VEPSTHIFQVIHLMELAPFLGRESLDGCRGFNGPFPSTPLDVAVYVGGEYTRGFAA
jgi:hypothetical protein